METRKNSAALALEHNGTSKENQTTRPSGFVIQATAIAGFGGILFGYDLGVISGALPQLTVAFDLSHSQQELVVSILYLGGFFGAALGGSLCDACGRKRAIVLTDILFLLGALVLYAAPDVGMVVVGRVVVGFATAFSGIADVSYLHEIAPIQWRGSIVSVNEACISLGFLLAFTVGSIFSAEGSHTGWRIMFGCSGLVAVVQLIGMLNMPESPTWLKERGREEESEAALRRINGDQTCRRCYRAPQDLDSSKDFGGSEGTDSSKKRIEQSSSIGSYDAVSSDGGGASTAAVEPMAGTTGPSNSGLLGRCSFVCCQLVYLFEQLRSFATTTMKDYRRQAYIGLFLAVVQQWCGQTNVLSYAPIIFASVGGGTGDHESSSAYVRGWSTLSMGLVKFAVTVLVIWKVESVGRRSLLLAGMSTISAGLLLLTVAFAGTTTKADKSSTNNQVVEDAGWGFFFALPGVLLVVCGYSMSFGPLTWLLTSELFPTDIRGRALGVSTIVTYFCACLVTITFLSAQDWLGASVVFSIYFLITTAGCLFAYLAIPDTAGKTPEEINSDLAETRLWKPRRSRREDSSPLCELGNDTVENRSAEAVFT